MRRALFILPALLFVVACGDKECEEEAYQCDGDILQVCSDGAWEDDEDCGAQDLMCHAEMGHCMAMDDSGEM